MSKTIGPVCPPARLPTALLDGPLSPREGLAWHLLQGPLTKGRNGSLPPGNHVFFF